MNKPIQLATWTWRLISKITASVALGAILLMWFADPTNSAPIRGGYVTSATISRDGKYLIATIDRSSVASWAFDRLWDYSGNSLVDQFSTTHFMNESVAWSTSRQYVTSKSNEKRNESVLILDLFSNEQGSIALDEDEYRCGAIYPDGRTLIYAGKNKLQKVDLLGKAKSLYVSLPGEDESAAEIAANWNRQFVAVRYGNGLLELRDMEKLQLLARTNFENRALLELAFTEGGGGLFIRSLEQTDMLPISDDKKFGALRSFQQSTTNANPASEPDYVVTSDGGTPAWRAHHSSGGVSLTKLDSEGTEFSKLRLTIPVTPGQSVLCVAEAAGYIVLEETNSTDMLLIDRRNLLPVFRLMRPEMLFFMSKNERRFSADESVEIPHGPRKLGDCVALPDSNVGQDVDVKLILWQLTIATRRHERYDIGWRALPALLGKNLLTKGVDSGLRAEIQSLNQSLDQLGALETSLHRVKTNAPNSDSGLRDLRAGIERALRKVYIQSRKTSWIELKQREAPLSDLARNAWHLLERDLLAALGDSARLGGDKELAIRSYEASLRKEPNLVRSYDGLILTYLNDPSDAFDLWLNRSERRFRPSWLNGGGPHIAKSLTQFYNLEHLEELREANLFNAKKDE